MKIIAISDTHFNYPNHREPGEKLVEAIAASDADVLVHAGDFSAADLKTYYDPWLNKIEKFRGVRIFVPGNHDVWTYDSSESRYREVVGHFRARGWTVLDGKPLAIGDVAFVGNMNWYDYSYFDKTAFENVIVGTNRRAAPWRAIADADIACKEFTVVWNDQMFGFRWVDAAYAKWDASDALVTRRFNDKLKRQLKSAKGKHLVCVTHFLPFKELVTVKKDDPIWTLGNSFVGSAHTGEILKEHARRFDKCVVICGHTHIPQTRRVGRFTAHEVSFDAKNPRPWEIAISIRP